MVLRIPVDIWLGWDAGSLAALALCDIASGSAVSGRILRMDAVGSDVKTNTRLSSGTLVDGEPGTQSRSNGTRTSNLGSCSSRAIAGPGK
jgi:hypothetical protein